MARGCRAHHDGLDALHGQAVAGFRLDVTSFRADRHVGVKRLLRPRDYALRFGRHAAVIDEGSDRDQLRELSNATVVIRVEVGDEEIIDLRDTGVTHRGQNAVCVSRFLGIAGRRFEASARCESRIDEQSLSLRRYHQRGLPTFDVDEIDVERLPAPRFARMRSPKR